VQKGEYINNGIWNECGDVALTDEVRMKQAEQEALFGMIVHRGFMSVGGNLNRRKN
jgi:hypothetical protein